MRQDDLWQASVATSTGEWSSKPGPLEEVILATRSRFVRPVYWLHPQADYYRAFETDDVRIKTAPETALDRRSIQVLIDAIGFPWLLDFTDARISERDLSRATIQQEWSESPYASSKTPPMWRSRESGGLYLFQINLTDAWLSGTNLSGANLTLAKFGKATLASVDFTSSIAQQASFEAASLHHCEFDDADLISARFRGATFDSTSFTRANLMWADLRGTRIFHGTTFDEADFRETHLEGVDLYSLGTRSLRGAFWATAYIDRTRIRREQLGEYVGEESVAKRNSRRRPSQSTGQTVEDVAKAKTWVTYWDARESYLNLKNNFNTIGRYADASWAYRCERTMERRALGQDWRAGRQRWSSLWRWLWNWLACLLTDYGESPQRPVAAAVGVVVAFWGLYFWLENVGYESSSVRSGEPLNCWDSLIYSAGALVGIGFPDFVPLDVFGRVLTVVESGIGLALIALTLYCVGNRISRS